jgi:hypothetical protein
MKRNINLFLLTTILGCACFGIAACSFFNSKGNGQIKSKDAIVQPISGEYGKPRRIATIADNSIIESSGLAASRRNKDIFWTHNDSGDDAYLYAFDSSGKRRAIFRVPAAKNYDWEDIAAYTDKNGENYLFIGDIGDNGRKRSEVVIYRVREPETKPEDEKLTKKTARQTARAEAIRVKYPDGARDAETLLANPANGDLYIISKSLIGGADVYKLSAPFETKKTNALEHIGGVNVPSMTPGFLTGGSISPDGKRLILSDYFAAYEFVLPAKATSFDEIWKQKAVAVDLGEREQGEAVCYGSDGKTIYATSEKKPSPLIEVRRK